MSAARSQRRDRRSRNQTRDTAPFNADALRGVDTVIIDIGDTLVATGRAYTKATRTFYDGLRKETRLSMDEVADGLRHLRNQEFLALPYGLNQHPGLREKFPTGDLVEQFAPLRQRTFQEFMDRSQADRDTVDFLKRLKKQGTKVIFMTSLPESAARFVIQGAGLSGLADKTYAAMDIEQDPALADGQAANSTPLNDSLGGGTDEPIVILDPELDVKQQLAAVMDAEGAQPASTLRIADNRRKDIAPANELGLRTALMTGHRDRTDDKFLRAMRELRQGTGEVQPPYVLPHPPRYQASRDHEAADYVIHTSKQMHGAAYHLETGKAHPAATTAKTTEVTATPPRTGLTG
ncbi:MAG: hypothetical protein AAF213_09205 [Pseudomonadota bacterium]